MKISKLIEELQKIEEQQGDVDVEIRDRYGDWITIFTAYYLYSSDSAIIRA